MISLNTCRNSLIRFLIITLVIASLIVPSRGYCQDAEDSQIFISGFNSYQQKDYTGTIEKMSEVLQKYPDTPLRDMALFWLSRAYYKNGNLQDAAKYLSQFSKEYPDNPLKSTVEDELLKLTERYDKGEKLAAGPVVKPATKPASQQTSAQSKAVDQQRVIKSAQLAAEKAAADKAAAEKAEQERVAAAKLEADRLAAQTAQAEKLTAEKAAADKLAAEQAALKLAAEKAAADKAAAEKTEQERVAAAKLEADRLAAQTAQAEKLAAEKAAAAKMAAEQAALKLAAEKAAADKAAAAKAEQERIAAAKLEADRLAAQTAQAEKIAAEKAAAAKMAAEQAALKLAAEKAAADKAAAVKAEQVRLAALKAKADRKAAEKAEADRLAQARSEAERLAAAKAAAEKLAADKIVAEQAEMVRQAQLKAEQMKLEAEKEAAEQAALKLAAEKTAATKAEQERIAALKAAEERKAAEQAEVVRLAQQKAEQERIAVAKAEEARIAAAKAADEKRAAEKLAAEQAAARVAVEKAAAAKAEQERIAVAKAEELRVAAEQAATRKLAAEKAEQERQASLKAEKERQAAAAAERAAQAKAEQERLVVAKAEAERLAAERAIAVKQAAEKAEQERLAAVKAKEESRIAALLETARLAQLRAEQDRLAAVKAEEARMAQKRTADEKGAAAKKELREKAIAQYKSIIETYPNSQAATTAAAKLKELGVAVAVPVQLAAASEQPENSQVLRFEVAQYAGFEFNLLAEPKAYNVGQPVAIPFELINRGNGNDVFTLASSFPSEFKAWFAAAAAAPTTGITQTTQLAPGESFKGTINLLIPVASIDGLRFTHPVRASSRFLQEATQSREVKVTAAAPLLRAIVKTAKTQPLPGENVAYRVALLNVGSVAAQDITFRLDYPPQLEPLESTTAGFKQESKGVLILSGLNVNSGESKEFTLEFRLKGDSLAGQELLTRGEVRNNRLETTAAFVSNPAIVQAQRGVLVRSAANRQVVIPGQTVTIPYVVTNNGNIREKFKMTTDVTGAREVIVFNDLNRDGIRQASEPVITEVGPLAPREEANIVIEIKTPRSAVDASEGNVRISLTSEGDPNQSFAGSTRLVYSRPVLQMAMSSKGGQLKPGDVAAFELTITNNGTNLARVVELYSYWPEQLELVAAEPANSSVDKGTVLWKFKELGAGEKRTIKVSFRVKPATGVGTAIEVKNSLKYEDQLGNRY